MAVIGPLGHGKADSQGGTTLYRMRQPDYDEGAPKPCFHLCVNLLRSCNQQKPCQNDKNFYVICLFQPNPWTMRDFYSLEQRNNI